MMFFEDLSEVADMFRGSFPISLIFFIPIMIILSPVSPVSGAHDFTVFRMQQFELQGSSFGSKSAAINVEARAIDSSVYTRRCIISKLTDFSVDKYKEMVNQNAAGVLVLLPRDLNSLSSSEREFVQQVEQELIQEESTVPVYFAEESDELLEIERQVHSAVNSDQAASAAEALLGASSANGFQLVTSGAQAKPLSDFQIVNVQGKLPGAGIEEQLPTIAVVAHYDALAFSPMLSYGADSNGSGVAALLELARLFSKLYANSRTQAKYNMLFLLSGAGKFNYIGTKRWIEDQLEATENSLLADVSYVLCLDSLASGRSLNMHVSKPPKAGSEGDQFLQNLRQVADDFYSSVTKDQQPDSTQAANSHLDVQLVHKKINLADNSLAWEHERFSVRRLPAFTLSHLAGPNYVAQNTLFDTRTKAHPEVIARNVKVIAEALARQVFNLTAAPETTASGLEVFTDGLQVETASIASWLDYVTSQPRSAQLLDKESTLVRSLEQAFVRYLKDVQLHTVKADKRDPEFLFFDQSVTTMSAYNVKPAVFDLFLALVIAGYLGLLYLFVQNFSTVYLLLRKFGRPVKAKAQ